MNKTFFKICLGWLALAGLAWPASSANTGLKTLPGHVPAVVARLAQTGELAATNDVRLAIGLQVRNESALDDLIAQVSDPASPSYGHYLTPAKFTGQFAPTEADYQAVINFAKAQGLTVTATHANRLLLEVTGKASAVEHAFNVALHTYRHPTENRFFFAPDTEPSVPADLAILDISGLNNYARPHPLLHLRPNATNAPAKLAAPVPLLGSGPGGAYMGNDFRAAYVPGASQTGVGQQLALVQFDGYLASDIQQYEALNTLPNVTLTNILLNGFNGVPTGNGGEDEVSLDIEMVVSMAPGLNQVNVYEGDPYNFFPNVVLGQIAQDDTAAQISCSWGWQGGPDATSDEIFKEMIVQGQTFYHASGDSDAFLPGEVDDPGLDFFPSSDPYITQVGGTTLSTTGPDGAFISETVWNWDVEYGPAADGEGSCGGVSSFYKIPSWQTNVNMTANGGSTTHRNIPDVAMPGDNILVIADGGVEYNFGGTSCASPLWAAFTALVNQQAASVGHAPVGFINPALYALANSPYYNSVFNDVTTGNNTWSQSPNAFFAVTNYDLCTGLGSPHGTNLINALTSVTNLAVGIVGLIPAPQAPWGTNLYVMNGANPNGLWLLYLQDVNANGFWGTNYNGWAINLTTADPVGFPADNQLTVNTMVNSLSYGNATNVPVLPGSYWYLTLAVTNYGPAGATNIYVNDQLPPASGVSLVGYNSSISASSVQIFGGSLVWNLGNLADNAGGTLSLTFQVTNNASALSVYTNSATVTAASTDPNPDDDSVAITATVTAPPVVVPVLAGHGAGGSLHLSVTNDPGATVVIQASTNLLTWLPIVTNVSPFTYTNFDTSTFQKRFYRAYIPQ